MLGTRPLFLIYLGVILCACVPNYSEVDSGTNSNPTSGSVLSRNQTDKSELDPVSNGREGKIRIKGYYHDIQRHSDDGRVYRDSGFLVVDAPQDFIVYFKNLIISGNTINTIDSEGNLVIGISRVQSSDSASIVAKIKGSTESSPIYLYLERLEKAGELNTYFEIVGAEAP